MESVGIFFMYLFAGIGLAIVVAACVLLVLVALIISIPFLVLRQLFLLIRYLFTGEMPSLSLIDINCDKAAKVKKKIKKSLDDFEKNINDKTQDGKSTKNKDK